MFVIPQNFSEKINKVDNADKLYVIVEYDIKYNGISETITNTVYKRITPNFEQGKAYTINLTIGRPIDFDVDAEITPWEAGTTIPEISMD